MEFLLKSSAVLAIFYIAYFALLQRETFFGHNRWFLLSGILLSLMVPLITIPIYIEQAPLTFNNAELLYNDYPTFSSNTDKPPTSFNFQDYVLGIYFFGVALFVARLLFQLLSLAKISSGKIVRKDPDVVIIETSKDITPFSFFKWIVYNPAQFENRELQQILNHEKVHVKGLHSIDILLSQLYCIVFWFNPVAWLYSKSLKDNLEFIADKRAKRLSDSIKDYQYTLLKTIAPKHNLSITNNFYNSSIKKRIIMLQKSKSKSVNVLKYLFILPVLGWFLMSFNTEEVPISSSKDDSFMELNQIGDSIETYHVFDVVTDEQLQQLKGILKLKGYELKIHNLKRNHNNLIISIGLEVVNPNGKVTYKASSILPVKPIKIVLDLENQSVQIGNISDNDVKVVVGFPSQEEADNYKVSKKLENVIPENYLKSALILLDNKEVSADKINNMSSDDIESVKLLEPNKAKEKYGKKGKYGAVEISAKKFTLDMSSKKNPAMSVTDTENGSTNFTGSARLKFNPDSLGLIMLDGKPISKQELEKIPPSHVEKINVLKATYAREKYGDTLKGDVMEITTKTHAKNNGWAVTSHRNKNIIHATKDTIYVHKMPDILNDFARDLKHTPLFIVDGEEVSIEDFRKVDPLEVERLSIIKPGQGQLSEFGDRGKNGVVKVTLKTPSSKAPFIKVVGEATFIKNGKPISTAEYYEIAPETIKSINISIKSPSGKSNVEVVTK